jgi:DNA-binding beta-propeller fold protein YncE
VNRFVDCHRQAFELSRPHAPRGLSSEETDMEPNIGKTLIGGALSIALVACGGNEPDRTDMLTRNPLTDRAYVVSLYSDELTVIDLAKLEIIAEVETGGVENHMAELNADFTKVYVDASHSNETIIVDASSFDILGRVGPGPHPAHMTLDPMSGLLAIMVEADNAVAFLDTDTDELVGRITGLRTPHFLRFTPDGSKAYVANIAGNHITRIDMSKQEIEAEIPLDGMSTEEGTVAEEGGFADAQIDNTGILYAAHNETGRVLVYDTKKEQKLPELQVGKGPWVAFASHPFKNIPLKHLVPSFADQKVAVIDGTAKVRAVVQMLEGDEEAYGVNFSPLTPNLAFVMNRVREDIAVVDTETYEIIDRIHVGGNTETAATTPDGRYIVAAVSSANAVVVIDPVKRKIVKRFTDVGNYPWSVTIPGGQNYCH